MKAEIIFLIFSTEMPEWPLARMLMLKRIMSLWHNYVLKKRPLFFDARGCGLQLIPIEYLRELHPSLRFTAALSVFVSIILLCAKRSRTAANPHYSPKREQHPRSWRSEWLPISSSVRSDQVELQLSDRRKSYCCSIEAENEPKLIQRRAVTVHYK